jgi:hypothetical protein
MVAMIGAAAVFLLGLLAGAMLLVAVAFVPFWRRAAPEAFLEWFGAHGHRIQVLAMPLGVAGAAASGAMVAASWDGRGFPWAAVASAATLGVAAVYPLYFRPTNISFQQRAVPADAVRPELARC